MGCDRREFMVKSSSSAPIVFFVVCLAACTEDVPRMPPIPDVDAYVPSSVDAGQPDAGPPVCVGTPVPCSERSPTACGGGCSRDACRGTPNRCSTNPTSYSCAMAPGCSWAGDECFGTPYACASITESAACRASNCGWNVDAPCSGTAARCETMDAVACEVAPGCALAASDAGTLDAGTLDAGTLHDGGRGDAGRTPTPMQVCTSLCALSCVGGATPKLCAELCTMDLSDCSVDELVTIAACESRGCAGSTDANANACAFMNPCADGV